MRISAIFSGLDTVTPQPANAVLMSSARRSAFSVLPLPGTSRILTPVCATLKPRAFRPYSGSFSAALASVMIPKYVSPLLSASEERVSTIAAERGCRNLLLPPRVSDVLAGLVESPADLPRPLETSLPPLAELGFLSPGALRDAWAEFRPGVFDAEPLCSVDRIPFVAFFPLPLRTTCTHSPASAGLGVWSVLPCEEEASVMPGFGASRAERIALLLRR